MYHIANDKRAKTSARLIAEGLLKCIQTTAFENVTISDISKKSSVSRATFYRLFDNTMDVIDYLWDNQFQELYDDYLQHRLPQNRNPMIIFLERLMEQDLLIDIITKGHRMDIVYKSHQKYINLMISEYISDVSFSKQEQNYMSAVYASQLCGLLSAWCLQGKKETPEELMDQLLSCAHLFCHLVETTTPNQDGTYGKKRQEKLFDKK